jgi:hypothetical protein
MATDGGYDPGTGISTFGWVVASKDTVMVTGRGPAEAHPSLANSFRAEGYGASSALLFIAAFLKLFDVTPSDNMTWYLYIDNKSMVDRLSESSWKHKLSRQQLRPEVDITNVAARLIQTLKGVQISHVKSHQDQTTREDELSWPARLNIIADQQATEQRSTMEEPASTVTNTTNGMLYIKGVATTRDVAQLLWRNASQIPLQEYHQSRNQWTEKIFEQINWKAQHDALSRLGTTDQQRILKFVHRWLPTGKNLHREKASNLSDCPLCAHETEDNMHLFACQNPQQVKLQQELLLYIAKQQHGKEMPELAQLLEWALSNCCYSESWKVNKELYPQQLHKAIESQNEIGWHQIIYGRISMELTKAQEQFYRWRGLPESTHNGQRWTRNLLYQVWKTALLLWKNRNEAKHKRDTQAQEQHHRQQLFTWVQHCYNQAHILSAVDRNHLFQKTIEERLQETPQNIQAWVAITERIIRLNRQEDPHILKSRKKMEEYVNWKQK